MTYENKLLLSLVNGLSEIEKINYLKANLSLKEILKLHKKNSTKNLHKKFILFKEYNCSFVDDLNYPINLFKVEIPPFRMASTDKFPSPFDYNFGILGSSNPSIYLLEEYYKFGKDLGFTNNGLILLNFNGISKLVQKGYSESKKDSFYLLASGFDFIYPKFKNLIFLSPFEVSSKPSRSSFLQTYEIYGSLIDALILFQCGNKDDCKKGISSVLDCGTSVYVHKNAVVNNEINEISCGLYEQGCKMINKIDEVYLDL